jgi:hypothetical protein
VSSDTIAFTFENARKFILKLEEFPPELHDALVVQIKQLTEQLEARVKAAAPVKTGTLLSVIDEGFRDRPEKVSGTIFLDDGWAKAGALEYGAHKRFQVDAHKMRLNHLWSRAMQPITVQVPDYMRTPNIAERDFMRGPMASMQTQIEITLGRVLEEVTVRANE